jgi:hypothetical protein
MSERPTITKKQRDYLLREFGFDLSGIISFKSWNCSEKKWEKRQQRKASWANNVVDLYRGDMSFETTETFEEIMGKLLCVPFHELPDMAKAKISGYRT